MASLKSFGAAAHKNTENNLVNVLRYTLPVLVNHIDTEIPVTNKITLHHYRFLLEEGYDIPTIRDFIFWESGYRLYNFDMHLATSSSRLLGGGSYNYRL